VSATLQAVILVGGEGTRMRPLTDTRAKPMLPLVDRPMVEHQLDHLRRHGVRDVVFSCGYRPEAIESHFGDGSSLGMRLGYVVDPEPLGTAGAVKNAEALIESDEIVVRNGDILTDLDLGALREAHTASGAVGTLTLTPVDDPSAFGLVRLHPDRSVEQFLEKPRPDELRPGEPYLINAGTYLLSAAVLEAIPAGRAVSIERETFPAAVLIRALRPTEGQDVIAARRVPRAPSQWTDGPAKLCQALRIDGALNGIDLCEKGAVLFVEECSPISDLAVTTGPRVGLSNVPEPWKSIPWRFKVSEDYSPQSTRRAQRF